MNKCIYVFIICTFIFSSCSPEGGDNENDWNTNYYRCAATTKKGKRCKRKAAEGSIYCWQHKNKH